MSQAYHIVHNCKQRRREKQQNGLDSLYDAFFNRNCEKLSDKLLSHLSVSQDLKTGFLISLFWVIVRSVSVKTLHFQEEQLMVYWIT